MTALSVWTLWRPQMREITATVAKLSQRANAGAGRTPKRDEPPLSPLAPAATGKLEEVKVKFSRAVRVGMKGQSQPADFTVGLKQVYSDGGATVMLVVLSLARGGQLDEDGRVGVGARVIKVNRRKVAGLHGEVISRLLSHATEVPYCGRDCSMRVRLPPHGCAVNVVCRGPRLCSWHHQCCLVRHHQR